MHKLLRASRRILSVDMHGKLKDACGLSDVAAFIPEDLTCIKVRIPVAG